MCTVTWTHGPAAETAPRGGFEFFFNRDEARSRGPEIAPREYEADGVRYLSPGDSDAGGTWVSINEFGLALGLLNGYHASHGPERSDYASRGILVRELATLASPQQVLASLNAERLAAYRPLVLVAVGPEAPARLARWDGLRLETLADAQGCLPLSSSGVDPEGAQLRRGELLRAARERHGDQEGRALLAFHRGEGTPPDSTSACMSRVDAETRSLVHIRVTPESIELAYAAGRPDRTPLAAPLSLVRRKPR